MAFKPRPDKKNCNAGFVFSKRHLPHVTIGIQDNIQIHKDLSICSNTITDLKTPTKDTDGANKGYVDAQIIANNDRYVCTEVGLIPNLGGTDNNSHGIELRTDITTDGSDKYGPFSAGGSYLKYGPRGGFLMIKLLSPVRIWKAHVTSVSTPSPVANFSLLGSVDSEEYNEIIPPTPLDQDVKDYIKPDSTPYLYYNVRFHPHTGTDIIEIDYIQLFPLYGLVVIPS